MCSHRHHINIVSERCRTKATSLALPRYTAPLFFTDRDIRNDSGRGDIAVVWPFLLGDLLAL
jgi:hypothetical protein